MPPSASSLEIARRCLAVLVLGVCGLLLVHAFVLEAFQVSTGSMAPTLLGQHRCCTCAGCGCTFWVGLHPGDHGGCGSCYRKVACPNCGEHPSAVGELPEAGGDQVLVDKTAFLIHEPRRWQVVVMRLFGAFIIKRVVGLPGEEVLLREGDVYVNGRLARKSFTQALALRIPIYDQDHAPAGGRSRWDGFAAAPTLLLDGRISPRTAAYRHILGAERNEESLTDEYVYNGGAHAGLEAVHDFLLEANIDVQGGAGSLAVRLCDGQDWVEVEVPVGAAPAAARARAWPQPKPALARDLATGTEVALVPGQRYHVVMALVDRRLSFAVDGRLLLSADLPEPHGRGTVAQPVQVRADGAAVVLRNFRLYRDIHYGQHGENAVHGRPVLLGTGQYFVLGDNSPDSEDSRFWSGGGRVAAAQLVGRPLLVHLPSRGLSGGRQVPDWSRLRWLR